MGDTQAAPRRRRRFRSAAQLSSLCRDHVDLQFRDGHPFALCIDGQEYRLKAVRRPRVWLDAGDQVVILMDRLLGIWG
jgi:hypothetical protein